MICVLDASLALAWSFEDEVSPYAERVMESVARAGTIVPMVWPLEVQNALLIAVRRGRTEEPLVLRLLEVFDRLPIEIDNQSVRGPAGQRLFRLGLAYRLSVYDATYLELAIRQGLPLATQDRRLAEGAEATGVTILDLSTIPLQRTKPNLEDLG